MKKLILFTALFFAFSLSIFAQPKTVTDYFLAMPNDLYSSTIEGKKITNKAALIKHRKSLIKIEDIKNGYLKLEGPWEGWAEIALCDGSVKFWTYKAGKWADVTKSVFTQPTGKAVAKQFNATKGETDEAADESGMPFYYNLPRQGKIMTLACNECSEVQDGKDDFTIFSYEWNGTKFVKK
jgi:hypothetical protein